MVFWATYTVGFFTHDVHEDTRSSPERGSGLDWAAERSLLDNAARQWFERSKILLLWQFVRRRPLLKICR